MFTFFLTAQLTLNYFNYLCLDLCKSVEFQFAYILLINPWHVVTTFLGKINIVSNESTFYLWFGPGVKPTDCVMKESQMTVFQIG